jgi:uncharacterized protein HemY
MDKSAWLALVITLALTSLVVAVRLNYDLVRTVGYLVARSIAIFAFSAAAYFALYGLSILLEGLDYHKAHCDDSRHWEEWRTSCGDGPASTLLQNPTFCI